MTGPRPIKPIAPPAPIGPATAASPVATAAQGAPQQDPVQMQAQQAEQDLKLKQQQQESQNQQAQQDLKLQQAQQAHAQEAAQRKAAEGNAKAFSSGFGKVTASRLQEVKGRVDRLFAGAQNSNQGVFRLKLASAAMRETLPSMPKLPAPPKEITPNVPTATPASPTPPKPPEPTDWLERTPAGTHSPISREMFTPPTADSPMSAVQDHAWAPDAAAERYIRHVGPNKADPNFAVDFFTPRYGQEAAQAIGQRVQKRINQQNQSGVLADQYAVARLASWSSHGIDTNYWNRVGDGLFDEVTGADVMARQRSQAPQLPYYGSNLTPSQRLANTRSRIENLTSAGGQEKVWSDSAGLNIRDQGDMLDNFGRMAFEPNSREAITRELENTDAPGFTKAVVGGANVLMGATPKSRTAQKALNVSGAGWAMKHLGPLYLKMLRGGLLQTMRAHGNFSDAFRAAQAGQKWDATKELFNGSVDAVTAPTTALPTQWFGNPLNTYSTASTMFGKEDPTSAELAMQPRQAPSPAPANQVEPYQPAQPGENVLSSLAGMLPALTSGFGGGGGAQASTGNYYDSPEFYGGSLAHLNKSSNVDPYQLSRRAGNTTGYASPSAPPLPEIRPPQAPTPEPKPLTAPNPPTTRPTPAAPPPPFSSAVPPITAPGGGMPSVANEQFRTLGQLPPMPGIPEPSPWLKSIGNVAWTMYGPSFQRRPQASVFDGMPTAAVNPAFHEAARAANYANRTVAPWVPGPSQQMQLAQNFAPQLLPLAQAFMGPQE